MLDTQFEPWPSFTEQETNKVCEVLLSNKVNYWTGQEGRKFEKEFARFVETNFAIAVANGTLAIDLAFMALGIGERYGGSKDDEVIVTSRTFLASASSIVFAGAKPVFVDVDENTQNITAQTIEPAVTDRTKAVLCVHLAGMPCEMDAILSCAKHYGFKVVEDCAQAHGAKYKGKPVGSIGDIGCWSFCQDKIMTTGGEGGMVTTNDEQLWKKMWAFKDHGKSFDAVYNKSHPPGFRWVHESFGTNWRLSEMQSAIGRIQLTRMSDWSEKRRANASRIEQALSPFSAIRLVQTPEYIEHAMYKFDAFVKPELLQPGWTRDRIVDEIMALGVPCRQGSCSEIYLEKAFDNTDYRPKERLPVAKRLGETSLMFLVHPTLSEDNINATCDAIKQVMSQASQ